MSEPPDTRTPRDIVMQLIGTVPVDERREDDVKIILPDGRGGTREISMPRVLMRQKPMDITAICEENSMKDSPTPEFLAFTYESKPMTNPPEPTKFTKPTTDTPLTKDELSGLLLHACSSGTPTPPMVRDLVVRLCVEVTARRANDITGFEQVQLMALRSRIEDFEHHDISMVKLLTKIIGEEKPA